MVTLNDTTGGTFRLSFGGQTTAALDWDATNSEVNTALEALSTIDTVTVSGSAGGPYTITFTGSHAGQNVEQLTAVSDDLTNGSLKNVVEYEYDAAGQLDNAHSGGAANFYDYDGLGRVLQETMTFAGYDDTITRTQSFDLAGNRTQLKRAFGPTEELRIF